MNISQFPQFVAICVCATTLCGCHTLATLAYECGYALDPSAAPSIPENGGGPAPVLPPRHVLDGVSLTSHESNEPGPNIEEFRTQVDELTAKTQELQGKFSVMEVELTRRTGELLETRKDFLYLQGELSSLRATADQWQRDLVVFRAQLNDRNEQRQAELSRLTTLVTQLAESATEGERLETSRRDGSESQ